MHEDLFRTVQEATEGAYDVLGELGHDDTRVAYLARDLDSGLLTVLMLGFDADEIEVVPRLGPGVPAIGGVCLACGSPRDGWTDRCARCEARGYGAGAGAPEGSAESLLQSVRSGAAGTYDVLGSLDRVGGSPVYFAREAGTSQLVGLVLQRDSSEAEGFALVKAWEGPRAAGAAPFRPAEPVYEPRAADPDPWLAAPEPEEITDPMLGRAPAPPAYADDVPPRRRRGVGLLTGAAVGAVVVGGLVVFALQGTGADAPPQVTRTEPVAAPPEPPLPPADTAPVAILPDTPAPQPKVRTEQPKSAAAAESRRMAKVRIDGPLPGGWSRSVNGGGASSNPVVELRPRRPSTITVNAPGYCTESRTFQLGPGEEYRWVLSMRERPMVGEC
jgi:hypothetical protein